MSFALFIGATFLTLESIFGFLGVPQELIPPTKELILFSVPAMIVRIFCDSFKTFLLNQGYLKKVGGILGVSILV